MIWWILGIVSYLLGGYATTGIVVRNSRFGYVPLVTGVFAALFWPILLLLIIYEAADDLDWERTVYGWMRDGGEE